ncbi:hypothetical protein GCM10010116_08700 [Microbispora rosea subsp. aerata]|nr:hypothetical protein GCM10010116_08700 [Microbispora rosea subsp. aerata]
MAGEAQAAPLRVAHAKALHRGFGRGTLGNGFQSSFVLPVSVDRLLRIGRERQITVSGSSFLPVGPIWISVPIVGQTPQS